jgi:radical SAM protein with 4Fe4S-binding SPASM domain
MPKHSKNDIFNFLSKITFNKCWNALKVLVSYQLSKAIGRPFMLGLPLSISVEPTTACNLGCPECPSGLKSFTRPTGTIKMDFFRQTIDAMHKELFYLSFYFQGEPFLHKGFLDMVRYASSKNIYTATSTNAHFLTDENARKTIESGLDRLIISLDGTTQETYEQYRRNGQIDKVLEGTRNIIKWRKALNSKTPMVVFQFLVVRPNEHQVDEVKQLAREMGLDDVWFKTAQIYDYQHDPNQLIPSTDQFSRYRKDAIGHTVPKNKMPNHCWKMWHSNVIAWDGKVVPCCFDKDAQHIIGEMSTKGMKEIWESKKYNEFRADLMRGRKNIDICSNCSEGLKVWS